MKKINYKYWKKNPLHKYLVTLDNEKEFIEDLGEEVSKDGFAKVAKKISMGRTGLYKVFQPNKRPSWDAIWKSIDALGYQLKVKKIK